MHHRCLLDTKYFSADPIEQVHIHVEIRPHDQLAENHRGRPAQVPPEARIDEKGCTFYVKVHSPLLTDIELDFGVIEIYDLYPRPLPDLFAG